MGLLRWIDNKMVDYLNEPIAPQRGHLCDFGRICQEIIPGDVLLIEGRTRISKIIKNITQSPWTHSSLYIGRLHSIESIELQRKVQKLYKGKASEQLLIESQLGRGTIIRPVSHYKDDHIRICRPQGLSQIDAQTVIAYAVNHLGKPYSRRQILDLARYMIAHPLIPRRWQSSLFGKKDPRHSTKEICSTLIAEAFAAIRYPIRPTIHGSKNNIQFVECNPNLITPKDFDYSPYFSIIKYPFYSGQGPYYHNLPWAQEAQDATDKDPASTDVDNHSVDE